MTIIDTSPRPPASPTIESGDDAEIFNSAMTVDVFREGGGFKDSTWALFEIIDNAVEAKPASIQVSSSKSSTPRGGRMMIEEIGVLDDGRGMDSATLRQSLRFGQGTRYERRGMGRFGVGLPKSSVSQCKTAHIWSWQAGAGERPVAGYLSVDEIKAGLRNIPEPVRSPLPAHIVDSVRAPLLQLRHPRHACTALHQATCRKAETFANNLEEGAGRTDRRYLAEGADRDRIRQMYLDHLRDAGGTNVPTCATASTRSTASRSKC